MSMIEQNEPGLPSAIVKKPRTEAQIAAFEKMKAARAEKRLLGEPRKDDSDDEPKRKSLEMAAAMFMEMRKKDKEENKKRTWEEQINERVTKRMDEFEDRLINLFKEPVETYVEKRKAKKTKTETKIEEPTKQEREEVIKEPIYKKAEWSKPKTALPYSFSKQVEKNETKTPSLSKLKSIGNPFARR